MATMCVDESRLQTHDSSRLAECRPGGQQPLDAEPVTLSRWSIINTVLNIGIIIIIIIILTMSEENGASTLLKRPANDEIPTAWLLHKS